MWSSEGVRATITVYRNLLKAVEKHIGKEEHWVHFTDFIREEFRKNRNLEYPKDPSFIQLLKFILTFSTVSTIIRTYYFLTTLQWIDPMR
ncbi:hypothetical protein K7X08_002726 [Anisodus acutangulus]|uniref:Complex 1 LYR protein domain-containing protein n=1 Tax=Anisodus acutangulus TaxID=402998 RepID=A0A9Q1RI16_9SOLA|nr:hypothetical protein K7X08_002726 [Anisodus acutangulus]